MVVDVVAEIIAVNIVIIIPAIAVVVVMETMVATSGYDGSNYGGSHGNHNFRDVYDGHKDHHFGCKCKQDGYSNY
ncbi:hypothetical protein QU577_27400 [Priestia megaterium]|uniref:hypothetical protein n=1 Tax=Priestia megaterium TaxID=1404 RepID=UPI0025B1D3FF|nr:hypothetical protein [Priestia megaterium]MDN3365472.1 hypothetical protein [Priestia megaterium]WKU26137.1 hypothetical protein Q3A90_27130 [Priestia megaterium]